MALRLGLLLALCVLAAQASNFDKPDTFPSFKAITQDRGGVRVVAGYDATPGQFPHQVGIYVDMSAFCGGALISPKWVLTAGSCVSSELRPRYTAFLGGLNINLPSEKGRLAVTTTTAHVPNDFDLPTRQSDIALIELQREVATTDVIKPISLPPQSYINKDLTGQELQISGWGYTSDSSVAISPKLKYTNLKGMSNVDCASIYSYQIINDGILCCTGTDQQSSCQGDTGGALVMTDDDTRKQIVVAVASFTSSKGCTKSKPSGFTRVAPQLKWIESVIG